jgi:PST family polysaccharide transporter
MVGIVVFMHVATVVAGRALGHDAAATAACVAVVGVFTASALDYARVIRALDGVSLGAQIRPLVPPLVACAPMMLVIYALQHVLGDHAALASLSGLSTFAARAKVFGPRLAIEVVLGAVAFVPSALLLAPSASRQLLRLVADAAGRGRPALEAA